MTTKKITNTTRLAAERPDLLLAEAMLIGGNNAIEASEARGQRELVNAQRLPTQGCDDAVLTALGFVLGPPDAADPIFRPATFPPGWRLQATDHSMWSNLLDAAGRTRAAVFYKAAFYDRKAHMYLKCRFGIDCYSTRDAVTVTDAFATSGIQSFPYTPAADPGDREQAREEWERLDAARALAVAWLDEHYPANADVSAYWDEVTP